MADSPVDMLPWSQEAEEAVIGSLLIDPSATALVQTIAQPQDFHDERLGEIYRACLKLGQGLDFVTLNESLHRPEYEGLLAGLIASTPTSVHLEHYAAIVHRDGVRRRVIKVAGQMAQVAYNSMDSSEILAQTQSLTAALMDGHAVGDLPVSQLAGEFYDKVEDWYSNPLPPGQPRYLSTGFSAIDNMTDGMAPNTLFVLCGRPASGKSASAMEIARRVGSVGGNVLIFSLEMSAQQILSRWASAMSGVQMQDAQRGRGDSVEYIHSVVELTARNNVWIDDTPGLSPSQIRARALARHLQNPLSLVVVDHGGEMSPDKGWKGASGENTATIEGRKTMAMKQLAKELHCPVLLVLQLNRAVEGRTNKRPTMSDLRDCLTADARLMDTHGTPISISKIEAGQSILAYREYSFDIVPATVTEKIYKGKQPVYEVVTKTGKHIRATANHPFLTQRGWVKLGKLANDDKIVTSERLPLQPSVEGELQFYGLHPDLCRFLGYMVGDGTYQKHRGIGFTSADPVVLEDITRIVNDQFPQVSVNIKSKKREAVDLVFSQTYENGYGKPGGNSLLNWLKEIGILGESCATKRVPDIVFQSGRDGIANYLAGYLATDGCVKKHGGRNKNRWSVQFDTVSTQLADDIQLLLSRLGVISAIAPGYLDRQRHRPIYRIGVCGRRDQLLLFARSIPVVGKKGALLLQLRKDTEGQVTRDMYPLPQEFSIYAARVSGEEWRNVHRGIGKTCALRLCGKFPDSKLYNLATSDVIWEPIRSITPMGEEDTWDIRVPDTGAFVANGIVVHNSGQHEQAADVILALYRESYYDPTCANPNLLEVAILKNRMGPVTSEPIALSYELSVQRFRDANVSRKVIREETL